MQNKKKQLNTTSKYIGVSYINNNNNWCCYITKGNAVAITSNENNAKRQ